MFIIVIIVTADMLKYGSVNVLIYEVDVHELTANCSLMDKLNHVILDCKCVLIFV